jgi:tetratricopeptide (TPR) repeat protein
MNAGRLKHAVVACKELNQSFPGFAAGWYAASELALKFPNPEKALEYIDRGLQLQADNPVFRAQKAHCLLSSGRRSDALELAEQVAAENPVHAAALAGLGGLYTRLGDHENACDLYERAVAQTPDNALYHFNLASTRRFLGDFEATEASYNAGIALDPEFYEAYLIRAELRRQTTQDNHIPELEALIRKGLAPWRGEVQLSYALARECENIGEFEKSFTYLKRGADLRRANTKYSVDEDLNTMDRIAQVFTADRLKQPVPACASEAPLFILGLPRTGSTLVERIIGSHSKIFSAGELNNFAVELTRLIVEKAGNKLNRLQFVDAALDIDFKQLGENYLASSGCLASNGLAKDSARYFIDKMPLNFLYCGLIHLALPHARIIHVVRNPMDTCYAIYKQLFNHAYPFSYDLEDLGRYYLAYRKLMDHWYSAMPGHIHTVHYEELVEDQERQTRRLIDYCGLKWEDACLQFERNVQASTTASAVQVRQPIYSSSVGKWRHYEDQLQPLVRLFEKQEFAL